MSTTDTTRPTRLETLQAAAAAKLSEHEQLAITVVMLADTMDQLAASQAALAASQVTLGEVLAGIQAQDAKRDEAFAKLAGAVDTLGGHINRVASAAQEQMARARERAEALAAKVAADLSPGQAGPRAVLRIERTPEP